MKLTPYRPDTMGGDVLRDQVVRSLGIPTSY